jgi:predicted nucleotidyltransferase
MSLSDPEDKLKSYFVSKTSEVACAYLFGSAARGELRRDSDIDVAVLFEKAPALALDGPPSRLAGDLERLLGRSVDLIVLNSAPVDLIHRVLRDGRLLCEHNPSRRVAFEVDARNQYFDLLPHLRRYREPQSA